MSGTASIILNNILNMIFLRWLVAENFLYNIKQ